MSTYNKWFIRVGWTLVVLNILCVLGNIVVLVWGGWHWLNAVWVLINGGFAVMIAIQVREMREGA